MIDVQAVNAKLVGRSQDILRRLSGRSERELRDALEQAGGNVKKAMLILHGCTPDKAAAFLQEAGGHLRIALQLAGCSEAEIPTVDADIASAVPYKTEEK
jgi:N-acetylmuramic acid 6-phosphate etherase